MVDVSLFPEGTRDLGTGEMISPVEVNDNAIDITYAPGNAAGDPARIIAIAPEVPYIHFVNKIATVDGDKEHFGGHVTTENKDGTETVVLTGMVGKAVPQLSMAIRWRARHVSPVCF